MQEMEFTTLFHFVRHYYDNFDQSVFLFLEGRTPHWWKSNVGKRERPFYTRPRPIRSHFFILKLLNFQKLISIIGRPTAWLNYNMPSDQEISWLPCSRFLLNRLEIRTYFRRCFLGIDHYFSSFFNFFLTPCPNNGPVFHSRLLSCGELLQCMYQLDVCVFCPSSVLVLSSEEASALSWPQERRGSHIVFVLIYVVHRKRKPKPE